MDRTAEKPIELTQSEENKPLLADRRREGRLETSTRHSTEECITSVQNATTKDSCASFALCDPQHWAHRSIALSMVCIINFGSNFVYDNPVSLQSTIINVMHVDVTEYTLLYSLYAWPNVILAFFGGYLIDRLFGVRIGALIFLSLVCLGQCVFALGAFVDYYWLMLLGRFVYGLGGESLTVAQNAYVVLWAKEKELNLVFGLALSLQVLGSAITIDVNNWFYSDVFSLISSSHTRLGAVFLVGFGLCFITLLVALVLGCLDRRAERILERKENSSGEKIRCLDIKDFPFSFWLLVIVNTFCYAVFYNFNSLSLLFFVQKYGHHVSSADIITSLSYYVAAVSLPVSGFLLDKIGFNVFWVIAGTTTALGAHMVFGFLGFSPYIPYLVMLALGLAFSMAACAQWAIVAWLIPENQLGTAFGIIQCTQNLGFAVLSIVGGEIVDNHGYMVLEVSFSVQLCITLLAAILLYVLDASSSHGGKLNLSAWARKRRKQSQETEAAQRAPENSDDLSCNSMQ